MWCCSFELAGTSMIYFKDLSLDCILEHFSLKGRYKKHDALNDCYILINVFSMLLAIQGKKASIHDPPVDIKALKDKIFGTMDLTIKQPDE
jgi:DNA polymerase III epsilon subunit-like protein